MIPLKFILVVLLIISSSSSNDDNNDNNMRVGVNAHPYLISSNSCGTQAHPNSKRSGHNAPVGVDQAITFKMQFTNPIASNEAQIGEDNRDRMIPDQWDVGGNFYCKNCRMTITTKHTDSEAYKELLTVSAGSLLEQGGEMNGYTNYGIGVLCSGQRYDADYESNIHHYIWTAPNMDVGEVTLKLTAAAGQRSQFKTNFVTLTYDESIKDAFMKPSPPPLPPGQIESPSPPPADHFGGLVDADRVVGKSERNKIIAAHGAVMLFTWSFFPPLVMYAGRFKDKLFGKEWFKVHKYLANTMLLLFGIGLILANRYRVVTKGRISYPFEKRHGWSGIIAVMSLFTQPVLAYFRPAKFIGDSTKLSVKRIVWLWAHRLVTLNVIIFTMFSVRTGLLDYKDLTFGREVIDNVWNRSFIVTWVILVYIAIPIVLEIVVRHRGKNQRKYSQIELQEVAAADDVDENQTNEETLE